MVEQELVMLRYFLAFSWFCSLSPFFCNLCLKNGYPVHLTSRQTQPRQPLVVAHFFLVPRPRPLPRPRPASDFTCGSTESANGHLTTKQRLKDSGNQSGYIVLIYHIIIYIYTPKKNTAPYQYPINCHKSSNFNTRRPWEDAWHRPPTKCPRECYQGGWHTLAIARWRISRSFPKGKPMDFHSYVRLLEVNMRGWKTMFIYKNKLSFRESMFN